MTDPRRYCRAGLRAVAVLPPELLLFVAPAVLALVLISPAMWGKGLLLSGEFESSLDYGRIPSLLSHSWNDRFSLGFENYSSWFESSYSFLFNYSPVIHDLFFRAMAGIEATGLPALLVYQYFLWSLFFVGGWSLSRALWKAGRGAHVAAGIAAGAVYVLSPYVLNLWGSALSPLAHALALNAAALSIVLLRMEQLRDRPLRVLGVLFLLFSILLLEASLGINYIPFVLVMVGLLAAGYVAAQGFRPGMFVRAAGLLLLAGAAVVLGSIPFWLPRLFTGYGELVPGFARDTTGAIDLRAVLTLGADSHAHAPGLDIPHVQYLHFSVKWVVPAVALTGLWIAARRSPRVFLPLVLTGVAGIFLVKGTAAPLGGLNGWLHAHVSGFYSLGSTDRSWALVLLAYGVGAACVVHTFGERVRDGWPAWSWPIMDRLRKLTGKNGPVPWYAGAVLGVAIVIGAMLLVSVSFLTGDIKGREMNIDLPKDYSRLDAKLQGDEGRTLVLPFVQPQSIAWDYEWSPERKPYESVQRAGYSVLPPSYPVLNWGIYSRDRPSQVAGYFLQTGFNDPGVSGWLARRLALQRVVIDGHALDSSRSAPIEMSPDWVSHSATDARRKLLEGSPLFPKKYREGRLEVYETEEAPALVYFGQPLYVLGDLEAVSELTRRRPDAMDRPLVSLSQNAGRIALTSLAGQEVAVIDAGIEEMAVLVLKHPVKVDLTYAARFGSADGAWVTVNPWLSGIPDFDGGELPTRLAMGRRAGDLDVRVALPDGGATGKYVLLVRGLHTRASQPIMPGGTVVQALVDGVSAGKVALGGNGGTGRPFSGMRWSAVSFEAAHGTHTLTFRKIDATGVAALEEALVVPAPEWDQALEEARQALTAARVEAYYSPAYMAFRQLSRVGDADMPSAVWRTLDDGTLASVPGALTTSESTGERGPAREAEAKVEYTRVNPSLYRMRFNAGEGGMLVLRQAYSDMWAVSSGEEPIVTDFYATGFLLGPGEHVLEIRHRADGVYRASLALSYGFLILVLSAAAGLALLDWRRNKRRANPGWRTGGAAP